MKQQNKDALDFYTAVMRRCYEWEKLEKKTDLAGFLQNIMSKFCPLNRFSWCAAEVVNRILKAEDKTTSQKNSKIFKFCKGLIEEQKNNERQEKAHDTTFWGSDELP